MRRIALWTVAIGVFVGAMLLFFLLAGLLSPLPFWLSMSLLFFVSVVLASGTGSLANHLGAPRSWLVLAGGGLILALGPLLLYWMLGSWDAEFPVPRRWGRVRWIDFAAFGWWCALTGGALALAGVVGYVHGRRKAALSRSREYAEAPKVKEQP